MSKYMTLVFHIFDSSECSYGSSNEYPWNFHIHVLSYHPGRSLLLIFDSPFTDIYKPCIKCLNSRELFLFQQTHGLFNKAADSHQCHTVWFHFNQSRESKTHVRTSLKNLYFRATKSSSKLFWNFHSFNCSKLSLYCRLWGWERKSYWLKLLFRRSIRDWALRRRYEGILLWSIAAVHP